MGAEAWKDLGCLERGRGGVTATFPICRSTSLRGRPDIWKVTLGAHSRWQRSPGAVGRGSHLRAAPEVLGFLGNGVPRSSHPTPVFRSPFSLRRGGSFLSCMLLLLLKAPPPHAFSRSPLWASLVTMSPVKALNSL